MKKILILSSIAALGAFNAMGQGSVNLNPSATIGVVIQVEDTTGAIAGGAAVKIGTPATAAGFTTQGLGAGQVAITIWGAVNGTSLSAVEATTPLFSTFNATSTIGTAQGTYSASAAFQATTANITGWNGSSALEFIVLGVSSNGVYSATAEATGVLAATGANPATAIFGTGTGQISSMILTPTVPEPSTIALGGLGVAALLAFRRRK